LSVTVKRQLLPDLAVENPLLALTGYLWRLGAFLLFG